MFPKNISGTLAVHPVYAPEHIYDTVLVSSECSSDHDWARRQDGNILVSAASFSVRF